MTDDQNASGAPPGGKARRRPAPMIELEATEIESKPMADGTATSASSEQPSGAEPGPTEQAAPESPPPQSEAAAAQSDSAVPPRRGSVAWLPPGVPWQPIGAGVAGGAVVLVALLLANLVPGRDTGAPAPDARLARLEQQLRELAARPLPAPADRAA